MWYSLLFLNHQLPSNQQYSDAVIFHVKVPPDSWYFSVFHVCAGRDKFLPGNGSIQTPESFNVINPWPQRWVSLASSSVSSTRMVERASARQCGSCCSESCFLAGPDLNLDSKYSVLIDSVAIWRFGNFRLVLSVLDCTVWPANMSYLNSAIQTFNAIVTMSSQNAGVVYLPVAHAATTQEAVLKHRHKLEICLAKAGLYILNVITLQFIKQGSSLQDRRKNTQQALFVVTSDHKDDGAWTKSHVWERQTIPSVPLIRVSEMVGYDPESKPGAAARVEQMLVYFNCCFLCH